MKHRSESQWKKLVAEQASSGMTATRFAEKKGLSAAYFSTKRQQILRAGCKSEEPASAFVQLQRTAPVIRHDIRIHHGGSEIILSATTEPVWLAELMRALA